DETIRLKPGKLTAEEYERMKKHTIIGEKIVSAIPELHPIIPIIKNHHERWDGQGYPEKLAGEDIPLIARIVAIVHAFYPMTSNRPYHPGGKGRPPGEAFDEIQRNAGKQFDPQCAAAFIGIRDQIVEAMNGDRQTIIVAATR